MIQRETKMIMGEKFIAALMEQGLVDNRTSEVVITAEVGQPVTLEITRFGDDRLLDVLANGDCIITHDNSEAVAR